MISEWLLAIVLLVSWGPLLAVPVAMLRVMLVIARQAARRETLGVTLMGLSLPVLWLVLAAIILVVIPALIGYVGLVVYTLLSAG